MSNIVSIQTPGAEAQAASAADLLKQIVETYDTMQAWRCRHETEEPEAGAEAKETQYRLMLAILMEKARASVAAPISTRVEERTSASSTGPERLQVMHSVAERFGGHDPAGDDSKEFNIESDRELELLLNLSVDMAQGRGNHDTAMWWSDTLDTILKRLAIIPGVEAHKLTVAPEPNRGGWSVGAVANGGFMWLSYGGQAASTISAAIDLLSPIGSPPVAPVAEQVVLATGNQSSDPS